MATATRRVLRACPKCALTITVVTTDKGIAFEYDIAEWARICSHPGVGSSLVCPSVLPMLKTWLGNP